MRLPISITNFEKVMKKFLSFLLVLVSVFVLVGCQKKASVSVAEADKNITLIIGESKTIQVTVPKDFELEISSNEIGIASAKPGNDANTVLLFAYTAGTAEITVKVKGEDVSLKINVTVIKPDPTEVNLVGPAKLDVNATIKFTGSVLPKAAAQELVWDSSDKTVATVDQTGKVTGLKVGTTVISATSVLPSIKKEMTVEVVMPKPSSITVTGPDKVELNQTATYEAVVAPEIAIQGVNWSVSDETIATITAEGVLTAKAVGTVKVIATSKAVDTVKQEIEVTVTLPVPTSVTVTSEVNELTIDEEITLVTVVLPELADQSLVFESSNEEIATVDEAGIVKGIAAGNVTITVKSAVKDTIVATIELTVVDEKSTAFFVNGLWADKVDNDLVTYDSIELKIGERAFSTIAKALEVAPAGTTIIVLPGTYAEEITITKPVKLRTLNVDVNPTQNDAPFLAASETATTITGVWYLDTVSEVTIKGFSFTGNARIRMFGLEGNSTGFVYENNYAYDTTEATLAWKQASYNSYGVTAAGDTTMPGFINLAPYARWLINYQFINNKFSNVSDTNIHAVCVRGIKISGNVFENGDRDAIRLDYSGLGGDLDISNNVIDNFQYNGIYMRSYGGAYSEVLNANIFNNTFKNLGVAGATEIPTSTKLGAIATSGYGEQQNANFNIKFNLFENCQNYISLRDNVSNSTTWAAGTLKWAATIEYNAFIDTEEVAFYFRSLLKDTDTAATNTGNTVINHNFYGTDVNTKAVTTVAQFDLHKTELSNLNVYDTKALLDAAILELTTPE